MKKENLKHKGKKGIPHCLKVWNPVLVSLGQSRARRGRDALAQCWAGFGLGVWCRFSVLTAPRAPIPAASASPGEESFALCLVSAWRLEPRLPSGRKAMPQRIGGGRKPAPLESSVCAPTTSGRGVGWRAPLRVRGALFSGLRLPPTATALRRRKGIPALTNARTRLEGLRLCLPPASTGKAPRQQTPG